MNDDQKSFIKDVLKSEGWKLIEPHFRKQAENLRRLATQPPEAVGQDKRTWFSAQAAGIEEVLDGISSLVE